MNSFLEKMFKTVGPLNVFPGTMVPLHHNTLGPSKSIDFETGLLLSNLVEYRKPKVICELGTFRGYSTAWLLLGSQLAGNGEVPCGDVHAFEVFWEGYYGKMWYDVLEMRLDNFRYHQIPGGIWNFAGEVPEKIDFLYHDTEHLPNPTERELDFLLPRIPVGGMVVVDDMSHPDYRAMQNVVYEAFSDKDTWRYEKLNIGHGLSIAERLK